MTFELLKVCPQANTAWIELRVMYVRSTVTDRHARWVIINQNYCIQNIELSFLFFFFISFCLLFFSFHFLHISLFRFAFVGFVSFRFVSFSLISFRFYFVSHFIGTQMLELSNVCSSLDGI
jgi:hypothetical protein